MDVFLAPHNDDEVLFGTYTLLRHRPRVVVVLRSYVEAGWEDGPTYEEREAESEAACALVGVEYEQWAYRDDAPDWPAVAAHVAALGATRLWAPLPEPGGHVHHDAVGEIALASGCPEVRLYATYSYTAPYKTVTSSPVLPEPGWDAIKRRALGCYASQMRLPQIQAFRWPNVMDEYSAGTDGSPPAP